ncbi:MAG TPA: nitroreductase family protein [Spirochaetota bacterium]
MDLINLLKERYSVRQYEKKAVPDELITEILEAGRVAPTAANRQPFKIIVVRSEDGIRKLSRGAQTHGAQTAFIICGDTETVWVREYDNYKTTDVDCSIVTDHMMLEAVSLGLGTLWMTWFNPESIRREFDIPERYVPINILLVGYAAGKGASPDRHSKMRRPLNDFIVNETF